ncbi:hypothetical protein AVEN_165472-1 [Araneus ventricosus]|uniref:Uncharacterized protein n=1 Tax=Araneus ventricosus TaxID=182803 RepID=A0A4Y2TSJ3_ARAVE|nr:hypothetical protein AVEN_165472-1 [Araneus ventricosus]
MWCCWNAFPTSSTGFKSSQDKIVDGKNGQTCLGSSESTAETTSHVCSPGVSCWWGLLCDCVINFPPYAFCMTRKSLRITIEYNTSVLNICNYSFAESEHVFNENRFYYLSDMLSNASLNQFEK